MDSSQRTGIIAAAIIGLAGSLGAAAIANWDKIFPHPPPVTAPATGPQTATIVAPHAPPIEVNGATTVWGENTQLISLAPGQSTVLKAQKLYAVMSTYPVDGCIGPSEVLYTWQVRDPYPEGGDLEIRSAQQGGGSEQVGLGAMGRGTMLPCDEHTFKNNGLQPMRVEVRYETALEKTP